MDLVLPSSHVGVKINDWYKMIRQFSVPDAEILKVEVEQEIKKMEEDQDLLIYYSLMCFRHQLMLDYLEPEKKYRTSRPSIAELLEKIETPQKKLTGLLKYYSLFFRGMYEFDHKEYVEAINFYRKAEKELYAVKDEIEQAEFHFKVAEAYYNMKQTHVSMHHILKALEVYDQHPLYKVRKIQSLFVVVGNYLDFKHYEKGLQHLEEALKLAKELGHKRLITSALYNLGESHHYMDQTDIAEEYLKESITVGEEIKSQTLPHCFYSLAIVLFKQKKDEASIILQKGLELSKEYEDHLFVLLNEYLKALYVEGGNEKALTKILDKLKNIHMFSYIEELTLLTANYFKESKDYENATMYYDQMVEAQLQIQRGDCLYEY
ncbi:Rap family tetratricopeptide repeat protein [Bacillus spizizenii]|uniref:Rap family tetratricopeptide repeat protein n=1 Tax=Bacillus spizizenii TaxID=96241 RepID=UPI0003196CC3|nr:Rap family tetratricopeptide repeat protein [Bacillus spizizenii]